MSKETHHNPNHNHSHKKSHKNAGGKSHKNTGTKRVSQHDSGKHAFTKKSTAQKSDTNRQEKVTTSNEQLIGTVTVTGKGVGYVALPDFEQDIEIEPHVLNTALQGDTVEIYLHPKKHNQRRRGQVVRIVLRAKETFVGVLEKTNGVWHLDPDDRKVYINFLLDPSSQKNDQLKENHKAVVRLVRWDDPKKEPLATLVEILGKKGEHEVEMEAIVRSQGFDYSFPPQVQKVAETIQQNKEALFAVEAQGRRDMRGVTTFTIDPVDAKDFDDAISVQFLEGGAIELGVHIADVSAWVKEKDPIDVEAQKRGTSIYLVDRTIPMLPEVLSNDVCSINPQEDKLAFSAIFTFDKNHEIQKRWFGRTIIKSDTRFAYEEAQKVLDIEVGEHVKELKTAEAIAKTLRKKRFAAGSIAFETDEIKFTLNADGKPVSVALKVRQEANLLIEDLMLLANREVTEYVNRVCKETNKNEGQDPCVMVYRVHDEPNPEKLEKLSVFLSALGFELKQNEDGTIPARAFNALFELIEDSPSKDLIETAAIRSMAKAVYSTRNIGHFGLAFRYYTHFTSPIRRYPDLMVHRLLARYLAKDIPAAKERSFYEGLCKQSSEREVSAVEAERESIKLKQVEYLSEKIGQTFEGVVTGVTEWGLFIADKESKAEGLLRVSELRDDYYNLDAHGYTLVGEKRGRSFSLGDTLQVVLLAADIEHKTIDWGLVPEVK